MTRYIAFLRAVNVGGRVVKMEELRKMFAMPGFKNISTYIQSGNVIFDHAEPDNSVLERKIEAKLLKELGYEVKTILKTIPEMEMVIAKNPFEGHGEDMGLYVTFLTGKPEKEKIDLILSLQTEEEQFKVLGTEVYILVKKGGYGNSIFSNTFMEKKLKVQATTRNWATVNKMLQYK